MLNTSNTSSPFRGAITALVTPMRDGSVDYDAMTSLMEEQIAAGISAIVAVGTTGESATLGMREHKQVISHLVHAAKGRIPIIAGAGGNATAEALELTRASQDAGAAGLLHVTPYYNKPNQDGLYRHFATIAESTELPIVLYNVPGRTACDLAVDTTARLAKIANIVAIKDATGDLRRGSELIEACGADAAVLSGDDFTFFPLLCLGGQGVISVVSNVLPRKVVDLCRAVDNGEWHTARELHYALQPLTRLLFAEPNPIPVKAALHLAGKIPPDIRAPLYPASDELTDLLRRQLKADGVL